jgi:hypothetical protein
MMKNVRKSRKDVKRGRLISWSKLQERWKKEHAKV